jgi:hypothetical protein
VLLLQKFIITILFISICAFTSIAEANSRGLFSYQKLNSTNYLSENQSSGTNSDLFDYNIINFTAVSSTFQHENKSTSSLRKFFEDITAISLQKDHDNVIWSLTPSLNTFSLNPIDDIKNVQVLLRYRF